MAEILEFPEIEELPLEPDRLAVAPPPDLSGVKPSAYEQIQLETGQHDPGMLSGDEMLRSVVQAPRQIPGAMLQAVEAPFSAAGRMLNAAVQDVGTTLTGHPEYGGNVVEFFNRTAPEESATPLPYQETLRDISRTSPVAATAGKIAAGVVESAPMMAVGMPEGALGRLVALGFSADMIRNAGPAGAALGEEMGKPAKDRDMDKVTGAIAELSTAGVLSPLMAAHAIKRAKSPELQGPPAEAGPKALAEAQRIIAELRKPPGAQPEAPTGPGTSPEPPGGIPIPPKAPGAIPGVPGASRPTLAVKPSAAEVTGEWSSEDRAKFDEVKARLRAEQDPARKLPISRELIDLQNKHGGNSPPTATEAPDAKILTDLGIKFDGTQPGAGIKAPTAEQLARMSPAERKMYADIAAQQGEQWAFTPQPGSAIPGRTFYVRKGASPEEIRAAYDKKLAQEKGASAPESPNVPPKPGGPLLEVPKAAKPIEAERQQIVRMLQSLEIEDERAWLSQKDRLTPREGKEDTVARLRKRLAEIEAQLLPGGTKPAESETAAPIPATEAPKPTPPIIAPPAKGMVRLYSGSGGTGGAGHGGSWFTENPQRAASFGPNVTFVDVPASVAKVTRQGIKTDYVLPDKWVRKAAPFKVEQKVHDLDAEADSPAAAPQSQGEAPPPGPPAAAPAAPASPVALVPVTPAAAVEKVQQAITEKIVTDPVEASSKGAKHARALIIQNIQKLIDEAPAAADTHRTTQTNPKGEMTWVEAKEPLKQVTIEIPGDGKFTVLKTKENLTELLSRAKGIKTSPQKSFRQSKPAAGVPPDVWVQSSEPSHTVESVDSQGVTHTFPAKPVTLKSKKSAGLELYLTSDGKTFLVREARTGAGVGESAETVSKAIKNAEEHLESLPDPKKNIADFIQAHGERTKPLPGVSVGPGAASPGDVPLQSQLTQLSQVIRAQSVSPREPFASKLRGALDLAGKWGRGKDALTQAVGKLTAAKDALWSAYKNLPVWNDFTATIGRWVGADSQTALQVREFQKAINKAIPNKMRREAITNWIQADGDEAMLRDRAAASKPHIRKGYEAALTLNEAEKTIARNIQSYFESRLQEGIEQGILKQGVEHYITQIWQRPTTATQKLWADLFGVGTLNPNFKFAKKRIFESYFEGEQTGHIPKNKDVGHLIAVYDMAFNRALSARAMIRELHGGTAKDGKPIVMTSGRGIPLPQGVTPPEAILIKPNYTPKGAVSADGRPYRPIDHWALRDWKWAQKVGDTSVFVQGDMLVHPDHWPHLNNVLKNSRLQQHPVTGAILRAGSLAKQTKLSLSPFHTVQEGVHALAHRVNPFRPSPLDLTDLVQKSLVDHGLMVADPRGYQLFTEGMGGGGLVGKIPGLGHLQQAYTEMTFQDYIPRLKMAMAVDALGRNRRAYARQIATGKISDDQIIALTARESNAAFGEQNYRMMGRSPNVQDFFRLALLAPDFLEARFRFVGQALKPYGREQRIALALMGTTVYTGARVLNKALDDDYHWLKPFSVFSGGKEYRLRTVLGDVQHLMTDPRSFWYNRLSPVTRTAMEYATSRDDRGIRRSAAEQFVDFLSWFKPIPLQIRPGESVPQSLLAASGVPARRYGKQQELYEVLDSWRSKQTDPNIKEAYDRQRQETHVQSIYGPLRLSLAANNPTQAKQQYQKLLQSRSPEQIQRALNPERPFTGSRAQEEAFFESLSPQQQKLYQQAREERRSIKDRLQSLAQ